MMKEIKTKVKIPIIVDTREKDAWTFSGLDVECQVDKLDAGDFTIVGHDRPNDDHSVIIERKKNCQELIGNIGTNWERFKRELEQLKQYKHRRIVVCGPNDFNLLIHKGFTKLNLPFIYKRLAEIEAEFEVPILFFPNHEMAGMFTYRYFRHIFDLNNV